MKVAYLLSACLLGAGRPLPEPLSIPQSAFYVSPAGKIDLQHPLSLSPVICGPAEAEDGRGWWDAYEGVIRFCHEGESVELPGEYGVVIGRRVR